MQPMHGSNNSYIWVNTVYLQHAFQNWPTMQNLWVSALYAASRLRTETRAFAKFLHFHYLSHLIQTMYGVPFHIYLWNTTDLTSWIYLRSEFWWILPKLIITCLYFESILIEQSHSGKKNFIFLQLGQKKINYRFLVYKVGFTSLKQTYLSCINVLYIWNYWLTAFPKVDVLTWKFYYFFSLISFNFN